MAEPKLTFRASSAPAAQETLAELRALYPDMGEEAQTLICIGGDGFLTHLSSPAD